MVHRYGRGLYWIVSVVVNGYWLIGWWNQWRGSTSTIRMIGGYRIWSVDQHGERDLPTSEIWQDDSVYRFNRGWAVDGVVLSNLGRWGVYRRPSTIRGVASHCRRWPHSSPCCHSRTGGIISSLAWSRGVAKWWMNSCGIFGLYSVFDLFGLS